MVRAAAGEIDAANDADTGGILQIDSDTVVARNFEALQQEVVRPGDRVRDRVATGIEQVEPGHFVVIGQRDDVASAAQERVVPRVRGTRQNKGTVDDATTVGREQVGKVSLALTQQALIVLQRDGTDERCSFGR